jgi:RNA-directed DNA polymerase
VETHLKLKVNKAKSAVARPWQRKFLGYSFTAHKESRIRVPAESIRRFRKHLKQLFRVGRGRNLARFISEDLNPVLRGWINYFRLAANKGFAEDLDKWIRRRLRLILWRQWKRSWTRFKNLMKRGIAEERASSSAFNGRGPWFNSGASHMNHALLKKSFDVLGLFSLLGQLRKFGIIST